MRCYTETVSFELVPTLEKLRDLYSLPRGPERFQAYLELTVGGAQKTADVALPPLVMANPMAKANVLEFVEDWLALGAEKASAETLAEADTRLAAPFTQTVKVGLTVLDDLGGGWTNRTVNDMVRFQTSARLEQTGWLSVALWTSEAPNLAALRLVLLEAAYRATYVAQQGDPQTVRAMLEQEGRVAAFAGRTVTFDLDELDYSRAVIEPYYESTTQAAVIACLYGDDAAKDCGHAPLGLSKHAGFQVGLARALALQKEVLT